MKISEHFKMATIYQFAIAGWVFDIKNTYLRYAYQSYFVVVHASFIGFMVTQAIQTGIEIEHHNWDELIDNMSSFLSYVLAEVKIHLCRSAPIQGLLRSVEKVEDKIKEGDDEPIRRIYLQHAKRSNIWYMIHVNLCCFTAVLYCMFPKVPVDLVDKDRPQKYVPIIGYVWFDLYNHVTIVKAFQCYILGVAGITYSTSDCVIFGLLSYTVGQLKILQHYFENIHKYALKIHRETCVPLEQAQMQFTKTCITTYNDIIGFMKTLNATLNVMMFFTFFQSSVKIAFLLIVLIKMPVLFSTQALSIALYVALESLGIYFYYWNANEVLYESSEGLTRAIWNAEWYRFNDSTKKALLLTLTRTRTPCKMRIGPFYDMNIDAAFKIVKGCYGYICLIQNRQAANEMMDK